MDLNDTQENLLESFAKSWANVEDLWEENLESFRSLFKTLLYEPSYRNSEIFPKDIIDLDMDDLLEIPPNDRDLNWIGIVAELFELSKRQAFAQSGLLIESLKISESHTEDQVKLSQSLSTDELRAVAKAGITKARVSSNRKKKNG